jgi:hypothetical protein
MSNMHLVSYKHNGEWCDTWHSYGVKQSLMKSIWKATMIMHNMVVDGEEGDVKSNSDFWLQ